MMLLITEIFQMTPINIIDIMNIKSDLSESEYNSVSKMNLNAEMSEIIDVLDYFAVRNFELL